jgi:hypothetical protein
MRMPGADEAVVTREKITGYLLSASHPVGRHKARFFRQNGFSPDQWTVLAEALVAHGKTNRVSNTQDSIFGTKYTVEGPLTTPGPAKPEVRTIWFVPRGESRPLLVTAYPCA